jgi:hypothetical protein
VPSTSGSAERNNRIPYNAVGSACTMVNGAMKRQSYFHHLFMSFPRRRGLTLAIFSCHRKCTPEQRRSRVGLEQGNRRGQWLARI